MRKILKSFEKNLITFLNKYRLRTKLVFLFVICVILPIVIIDSLVMNLIVNAEREKTNYEMMTISDAVAIDFDEKISQAEMIANRFYISSYMNNYIDKDYADPTEYYAAYYDMHQNLLKMVNANDFYYSFYTDNPTIVPGGCFFPIKTIEDTEEYKTFLDSGREGCLMVYRQVDKNKVQTPKRSILYARKLSYFSDSKYKKIVVCNIEYNSVVRNLVNKKYLYDVYVCQGNRILFSNAGHSTISDEFEYLTGNEKIAYRKDFTCKGADLSVLIMEKDNTVFNFGQTTLVIGILIIFSILLPLFLMYLYNKSVNQRLYILSDYFSNSDINNMKKIEEVDGKDELAMLMNSYNLMVDRSNELIQTVFKEKIDRQETDLLKQRAELLALQSQINPHFLFNLLESIRMHSVIKGEEETADVLAKLSKLVRKNVEWTQDYSTIGDEMSFVEDYLALQKYRFGDRIQYSLDIEENCKKYYLPRLSLATFVENSCVHGMERKAGICNVDIKVYEKDNTLFLEVEDTGRGMDEDTVAELIHKMNNVTIDMITQSKHVGILNACLRLKMISRDEVLFDVQSEQGLGTYILVKIPVDKLNNIPTE